MMQWIPLRCLASQAQNDLHLVPSIALTGWVLRRAPLMWLAECSYWPWTQEWMTGWTKNIFLSEYKEPWRTVIQPIASTLLTQILPVLWEAAFHIQHQTTSSILCIKRLGLSSLRKVLSFIMLPKLQSDTYLLLSFRPRCLVSSHGKRKSGTLSLTLGRPLSRGIILLSSKSRSKLSTPTTRGYQKKQNTISKPSLQLRQRKHKTRRTRPTTMHL